MCEEYKTQKFGYPISFSLTNHLQDLTRTKHALTEGLEQ